MSYVDNQQLDAVSSQYLLIMSPQRLVGTWSHEGSSSAGCAVFSASFDYGVATAVRRASTELTHSAAPAYSAGVPQLPKNAWHYDETTSTLYVSNGDAGETAPPTLSDYIAVTYELYFGTIDANWHRSPLDTSSPETYFEPLIIKAPVISSSLSDTLFGYMPVSSSQVEISNLTRYLQRHLYDSSFKDAQFRVYHYLGPLRVGNIREVFRGYGGMVSSSDFSVVFKLLDSNNVFEKEYRNPGASKNFFDGSFPRIDPDYKNKPIRTLYGAIRGVEAVNIDYSSSTSSNAANRFYCIASANSLSAASATSIAPPVPSPPPTLNVRTYVDDTAGFFSVIDDDPVEGVIHYASGTPPIQYSYFSAVDNVPYPYLVHQFIDEVPPGSKVVRLPVGRVRVVEPDGLIWDLSAFYYTIFLDSARGIMGIYIDQDKVHSAFSMYITSEHTILCNVYGKISDVYLGPNLYTGDSRLTGNLTSLPAILLDVIKAAGVPDSSINEAAFNALLSARDDEISFCIPENLGENFPSIKELISRLALTGLLRVFFDADNKVSVAAVAPLSGPASAAAGSADVLEKSKLFTIDYQDIISDIFIEYARSGISSKRKHAPDGSYANVWSVSDIARYLHRTTRQRTYRSYHFLQAQAQRLADRLAFYFGDRRGIFTFTSKYRFFDTQISDVVEVTGPGLEGYEYDKDTERSRNYSVQSKVKSLTTITLELDDQKGIEDNSGDW